MPATVAIVAALPREVAALVRGVKPDAALLRHGIHLFRAPNAVMVAGGMGPSRVALAVEAALAEGDVELLVSTGLAGACSPGLRAGAVVEVSVVVDTRTGERFMSSNGSAEGVLATVATIATVQEKSRLAGSYGAGLVDMEAATVARLARAHGLEFRAVKAISDAHDFELASLSRFGGRHGSFRTKAFALHTALRPAMWAKAAQLGRDSNRALAALHLRLLQIVES